MKGILLTSLTFLFFLTNCAQNYTNESRQEEQVIQINVLSKDGEEIKIESTNFYHYYSIDQNSFDEQHHFLNKNEKVRSLPIPVITSCIREIFSQYTFQKLFTMKEYQLSDIVSNKIKSTFKDLKPENGIKIDFIDIILQVEFNQIANKLTDSGLLQEYEDLKSDNVEVRLASINRLLENGSETAYLIILEHWATEKDISIRNYIIKFLSEKSNG